MNKIKSQLENIISSNISTPEQREKAKQLLDALVPKPAPVAPTGNVTLNGYYHVFKSAHIPPEIVNFTLVVSPEYFAELQKQRPTNDPSGNEFANHANDQRVSAAVDFFLERFDPKKQQLLLPAARAKFPDFDTYIQERSSMK